MMMSGCSGRHERNQGKKRWRRNAISPGQPMSEEEAQSYLLSFDHYTRRKLLLQNVRLVCI